MSSPSQLQRLLAMPSSLRSTALQRAFAITTAPPTLRHISTTPIRKDNASPPPPQSSINHEEVSHFNALASSWWDPHGSSRLLHLMNPLRHKFIRRCRESVVHDDKAKLKYLDVGCGGGIFAESAARMAHTASVTGIDPTPEVIAVARRHQRQDPLLMEPGRLEYKQTSIEQLPEEVQYDIITVFEVVEHIRRPAPFLTSCYSRLKPGGWLIGSTISRTNTSWFTTKFVAEDLLRMVPRGTHDWNQYIKPNELFQWAKVQGELDVERNGVGWEVQGVVYVPGMGWREVGGSEEIGNYFFGVMKRVDAA